MMMLRNNNSYLYFIYSFFSQGLTVHSKTAVANAKQHNYPVTEQGNGCITVKAPDGYKFTLVDQDVTGGKKCS